MDELLQLTDRAGFYRQEHPDWPASWLHVSGRWLHGYWVLGNDYRNKSRLYGAYPPGYLRRVLALFPDAERVLHLFSGSLQRPPEARGLWVSLDLVADADRSPTVRGSATALPFRDRTFDLVLADPPYSRDDAKRYGVPMPNRRQVLRELHRVVEPGGVLVWLDCALPMYRKVDWDWFGAVGLARSTNHRFRSVVMFRRV